MFVFCWVESAIWCADHGPTKCLLWYCSIFLYFPSNISLLLLVFWIINRYVVPIHPITTPYIWWYLLWVHGIHGYSGELPELEWWKTYTWYDHTSVSRVSATWWQGKFQGVLKFLLPQIPEIHPLIILKGGGL